MSGLAAHLSRLGFAVALIALAGAPQSARAGVPERTSTARAFVRTVAGLAGRQLTERDRRALARALAQSDRWRSVQKLARLSGDAAAAYFLSRLKEDGDQEPWTTAASIVVGSSQPIARGPPPLTRGVLASLVKLYEFELGLKRGDADFELDRGQRRGVARALVKAYGKLPPRQRRALNTVPARWLVLRAFWARQSPENKQRFSTQYRRALSEKQRRSRARGQTAQKRRRRYDPDDEFVRHRLNMTSMDVMFDSMQRARNSTMSWD